MQTEHINMLNQSKLPIISEHTNQENHEMSSIVPAFIVYHDQNEKEDTYPKHWHAGLEIIYTKDVPMIITIDDVEYRISNQQFVLIAGYAMHSIRCKKADTVNVISITFDAEFLRLHYKDINSMKLDFHKVKTDQVLYLNLVEKLNALIDIYRENTSLGYLKVNEYLFSMLHMIFTNYVVTDYISSNCSFSENDKFRAVLIYVDEHHKENLSTQSVADVFGYSREHFCRNFKKYNGVTFKKYLSEVRLNHIMSDFKKTKESLFQLALEHGFSDEKGFVNTFRKAFGTLPSKTYRDIEESI